MTLPEKYRAALARIAILEFGLETHKIAPTAVKRMADHMAESARIVTNSYGDEVLEFADEAGVRRLRRSSRGCAVSLRSMATGLRMRRSCRRP